MANVNREELPSGLKHYHRQNEDVLAWSNQTVPLHKGRLTLLLIIGIILFVVTVYMAYSMFSGKLAQVVPLERFGVFFFFVIFCVIDVGILLSFMNINSLEMIKITNEEIITHRSGVIKSKTKRFKRWGLKRGVVALAFIYHQDHTVNHHNHTNRESYPLYDTDQEVFLSLNIIYADSIRGAAAENRELVTFWMGTDEQYQLFLLMKKILKARGWEIDFKTDYKAKQLV